MTKLEFIEAVASGLRKMNYPPDYLLIIPHIFNDWEWGMWEEETLLGIPVIKSYLSVNSVRSDSDCPVIPCFKDIPEEDIFMQVVYFQRGFDDGPGY